MSRAPLNNRRPNVTEKVRHVLTGGKHIDVLVTFGFDGGGRIRELFCADFKEGNDLHTLIGDGCMVVSLLLQHGYAVQDILSKMAPAPSSFLRTLVLAAVQLEVEE